MTSELVTFLTDRLDADHQWATDVLDFGHPDDQGFARRTLAEVDAKRRNVAEYSDNREAAEAEACPNEWNGGISLLGSFVLPVLALPYRDHPGYRSEWAPDGS